MLVCYFASLSLVWILLGVLGSTLYIRRGCKVSIVLPHRLSKRYAHVLALNSLCDQSARSSERRWPDMCIPFLANSGAPLRSILSHRDWIWNQLQSKVHLWFYAWVKRCESIPTQLHPFLRLLLNPSSPHHSKTSITYKLYFSSLLSFNLYIPQACNLSPLYQ